MFCITIQLPFDPITRSNTSTFIDIDKMEVDKDKVFITLLNGTTFTVPSSDLSLVKVYF